jgi:putative transposase
MAIGTISSINKSLDESLGKFAKRSLEEAYPYLILVARYENVREEGVICSQAVQIAIGINEEGRRRFWRWSWPTERVGRVGRR